MATLPVMESPTVRAIYKVYEDKQAQVRPRAHLGASLIGHECARALWYGFRWCGKRAVSGRMLRLFETGHCEEARVVANLRAIGVTVHAVDPNTRRQFLFVAHGDHFGGSLDGVVLGIPEAPKTWHLLEIKTHNSKSFAELKEHGVEKAKPQHWHQMQTYMGMAELSRALYVAVNKDTDELYVERVPFDAKVFAANHKKALRIIQAAEPLTRVSDNPDGLPCKWCDFHAVCHEDKVPPPSCRTCVHATPLTQGEGARWRCERHQKELSLHEQQSGCDEHLFIPALIPFAAPVDAGDDWISYQMKDRDVAFVNCGATGFPAMDVPHYASRELAVVDPMAIGHPVVEAARQVLDPEVAG